MKADFAVWDHRKRGYEFLSSGLEPKIIWFISQICTTETIITTAAIKTKEEITSITAISAFLAIVACSTADTFITVFTFFDIEAVKTIPGFKWTIEMFTILRVVCTKTQITIFQMVALITVVRVFSKAICEGWFWCTLHDLIKLGEEWTREIKCRMKFIRIPIIAIPYFWIVDDIVFIMWIRGDDLISCFATFSMVELSFVSPWESSSYSFIRTECWARYEILLTSKSGRNLLVKLEVFICHHKLLSAQAAFFGFYNFFSVRYHTFRER